MANKHRGREGEILARRAIEDRGFAVHDANIIFSVNCPNIDLIVFTKTGARYVQVKWSERPASSGSVTIDGSPWTEDQLYGGSPIFNKHDHYRAEFVVLVDKLRSGEINFYIAPPVELENLVRKHAIILAERPKRDGSRRAITFRKELSREILSPWRSAWHLLGEGA